MTKRARKPKAAKNAAAAMLEAVRFISIAQRNEGTAYQTHCALYDGFLISFDGIISAGCKVESTLQCCPHTLKLLAALAHCGEEVNITLDAFKLAVKSGRFRALVPCVEFSDLIYTTPDEPVAPLNDSLLRAFNLVAPLATEGAQTVYQAAILLNGGSVIGSNGAVLFEVWHGIDMPPGIVLPKAAIAAVLKAGKPLSKFGFSDRSFTFHFEDGSWIKSQLYDEEYPDVSEIIDKPVNPWPIPDHFYEAVEAVAGFSENDSVYFRDRAFWSHADASAATSFEIEGLPTGPIFAGKYLKMLQGVAERIDFQTYPSMAYFFGENVRGVVMGRTL